MEQLPLLLLLLLQLFSCITADATSPG